MCVLHREKDKFFVACLRPKKNFPSGISRLSRAATAKKSGPGNLRVIGKNRVLLNFKYVSLLVPYCMISEVLLLEYLIVNLRLWLFFMSQKPHPIIVLLYIERILSFSLRHKMHVFKVCSNSPFISSGSLSFFSFTWLQQTAPLPPSSTFCVLWVLVFNYFFDDLQRSKPGSHVFASSLTASNTKRANLTWFNLWKHPPRSYMTWLPVSQALISKIHYTLSANQKRDSEFNV